MKRRFVATIECDRLLPVDGFFPQIAQTLDMRLGMVAAAESAPCLPGGDQAAGFAPAKTCLASKDRCGRETDACRDLPRLMRGC